MPVNVLQNQVLPQDFQTALDLGRQNEKVVIHEFERSGITITPTVGKYDFDFFLPDGRSVEVKLDLRSQATNKVYFETATYNRKPDVCIYTLCYSVVLTRDQFEELYNRGKIVYGGDYQKQDRYVSKQDINSVGIPLWKFIKSLKASL